MRIRNRKGSGLTYMHAAMTGNIQLPRYHMLKGEGDVESAQDVQWWN